MASRHVWLRANLSTTGESSLPDVLQRTVDTARDLTHARCCALAVVDEYGATCELFSSGADPQTAQLLRSLPAAGEEYFPLGPVLGVPLLAGDDLFGHLYVVSPPGGQFGQDDQEALTAIAATAGIAVQNASLLEQRQRGREWLQATLEVTSSLLGCKDTEPLTAVARAMQHVAPADFVLVVLPAGEERFMIEAAVGKGTEHLSGYAFPRSGSITDSAMTKCEVVLVNDAPGRVGNDPLRRLAREIEVGPMMFVPLEGHQSCRGVMAVGRRTGSPCFDQADVEPAVAFANHAALALELADGRQYHQRLSILEDRQRIATELHDDVLQRLFALGMSLQSILPDVEPLLTPRIETLIRSADETITCIRTLIGSLHEGNAGVPPR